VLPLFELADEDRIVARAIGYALEHLDDELGLAHVAAMAHIDAELHSSFPRRHRDDAGDVAQTICGWHARVSCSRDPTWRWSGSIETGFRSVVTAWQRFARGLLTSPTAYRSPVPFSAHAPMAGPWCLDPRCLARAEAGRTPPVWLPTRFTRR